MLIAPCCAPCFAPWLEQGFAHASSTANVKTKDFESAIEMLCNAGVAQCNEQLLAYSLKLNTTPQNIVLNTCESWVCDRVRSDW